MSLADRCAGQLGLRRGARCRLLATVRRWSSSAYSEALIAEHGAVSEPVALAMAEGIRHAREPTRRRFHHRHCRTHRPHALEACRHGGDCGDHRCRDPRPDVSIHRRPRAGEISSHAGRHEYAEACVGWIEPHECRVPSAGCRVPCRVPSAGCRVPCRVPGAECWDRVQGAVVVGAELAPPCFGTPTAFRTLHRARGTRHSALGTAPGTLHAAPCTRSCAPCTLHSALFLVHSW